ncbi:MAG: 6-pyruvoyl trahydropterin synthase family protein, partial [Candidatus Heimdallarchaeaceae archaeon]
GHNYIVQISVIGEQKDDNMVINFYDLKRIVKPIVDRLDQHLLLPTKNKHIEIIEQNKQIIIKIPRLNKEYEVPKEDVELLPIENTTVEELSRYFSEILQECEKLRQPNIKSVKIMVSEYKNQGVSREILV